MKRIRWASMITVASLALGFTACSASDAESEDTLKIGYLASLTGPAANDAARDVAGAKVAVEELNDNGGVDGRKVELIVRDDKADPTVGTREARDLVLSEQVNVLAGGNISSVAAGIQQVAGQTETPYIISTAGAASLITETGNDYSFRAWTNSESLPGPVAEWAADQDFERVAIVYANYAFGIEQTESFKKILQEQAPDTEIVSEISVELTDSDFSSAINRLKDAKPDAIYMGGIFGSTLMGLVKQAIPMGLYDDAYAMAFISDSEVDALSDLGLPTGKQIAYNNYFPTIEDEFAQEFNEKIRSISDQEADGSDFVGYVTVQWIAAAVEAADSVDRKNIAEALPGLELDTFLGTVTMREDGQATGQAWYGVVTEGADGLTITDTATSKSDNFLSPPK